MAGRNLLEGIIPQQPIGRNLLANIQRPTITGVGQPAPPEDFGEIRQAPSFTIGEVAGQAARNIPESAVEFGRAVAQPFLHPIETAQSLGTLAEGIAQKFTPGVQPSEEVVDSVWDFFKDRYGGLENIKRTIAEDPVGFTADLSGILSAGGALAGKITSASSKAAKIAKSVGKVGRAIDPLKAAGLVVSAPLKMAGKLGKQIIGNITTGVGAETIQRAFNRKPDFIRALKGEIDMDDLLRSSEGALQGMKADRAADYIDRLSRLERSRAVANIEPIKRRMSRRLKQNFRAKIAPDGTLDLERSVFSRGVRSDVEEIYKLVNTWDDTTPLGLDTLKRQLDDYFAPSKNSQALVTGLKHDVKNEIIRQVPEYAVMTRNYEKSSLLLKQIERSLSLKDRASAETTIRKITGALKENNEYRRQMLDKLQEFSTVDFQDAVAGINMQKVLPQGLVGRLTDISIGTNILFNGIMATDPTLFAVLMASSPRAMAGFLNVLGKGVRGSGKVFKAATTVSPASFQVGRIGLKVKLQPQLSELE